MIVNTEGVTSSEYIANTFWSQNIAQVRSIVLLPYLKNNKLCQMAYIEISSWCDSEVAYNFIRRLKVMEGEAIIRHNLNEDWWAVQINTHYNGQPFIDASTVTFSQRLFIKEAEYEVEDGETLTESEFDDQSYSEQSFTFYSEAEDNEAFYGEKMCIDDLLDQKMYIEELLDEQMCVEPEDIFETYLKSLSPIDAQQSLYNQSLNHKIMNNTSAELNDDVMCGQYLCDKYNTYQFLCA